MLKKSVNQELAQRVSLETGIPLDVVNEVTAYQGKYSARVIKEGLFESIMWPFLGRLKANPRKVQAMNHKGITPYKQRYKTKDENTK